MFFKKRMNKMIDSTIKDAKASGQRLSYAVQSIMDWGNVTKRKNNHLKQSDFFKNRNEIIGMAVPFCAALTLINSNPKIRKQYEKLLNGCEKTISQAVREHKKQEIEAQVKKNIVNLKEDNHGETEITEKKQK